MRCALSLFLAVGSVGALAGQTVPADFEVIATAGGALPDGPGSEIVTVQVDVNGAGTYRRYSSRPSASAGADPVAFSLSPAEVGQLWQAVEANGFFGLDGEHTEAGVRDGTFARMTVVANGTAHAVTTRNGAVEPFDAIVATLNSLTPEEGRLVYDTEGPITFVPTPICEQPSRRAARTLNRWVASGPGAPVKPAPAASGTRLSARRTEAAAHPGTVVAYRMPLAEAVERGVATLTAKGEFFGDAVQIDIDNSGTLTSGDLSVTLYLELWGDVSDAVAAEVASAIESAWSGTTSGGTTVTADVVVRVSQSGSPPGTPGFHQIQMVPDSTIKHVHDVGAPFGVNNGTGAGAWPTVGSKLEQLYAHEAGHLFGFDDRYVEYVKVTKKDKSHKWVRPGSSAELDDQQLANEVAQVRPDLTVEQILEVIQAPGQDRITHPMPGFTGDIMGSMDGSVRQSDLDALAALAGLLVEIRPGDVFVNKDGSYQNMIVVREEDVFVDPGATKTLEGLYAACIDREDDVPDPGDTFDIAPPISMWEGVEAAPHVMALLDYINEEDRFCPDDQIAQSALWRLTDNDARNDIRIDDFLAEAGVDAKFRDLDFPRLSSPNALGPGTAILVPTQLFVPGVVLGDGVVVDVNAPVALTGDLRTPLSDDDEAALTPGYGWALGVPDGSAASLGATEGGATSFTPDVRGFYEVSLRVDLPASVTGAPGAGSDPFSQETSRLVLAADAQVETFEAGSLAGNRFFWTTGGAGGSWVVTDEMSHTGRYAVRSAPTDGITSTTLEATFDQTSDGALSFRYWVASPLTSDSLLVAVDGTVVLRRGKSDGWESAEIDLPAGSHTVTWTYTKLSLFSVGADRVWLDDVFFPPTAVGTDVADGVGDEDALAVSPLAPNPASATAAAWLSLPRPGPVRAALYDVVGREVAVVLDDALPAGHHRLTIETDRLASGLYVLRVASGGASASGRLTVLR